jgi:hypothetical protein
MKLLILGPVRQLSIYITITSGICTTRSSGEILRETLLRRYRERWSRKVIRARVIIRLIIPRAIREPGCI